MKISLIILGVILSVFVIVQVFAYNSRKNIESYTYEVIKKHENFEIRNYEASLFTSIKLSSKDYKNSSRKGFSILAGYIFSDNNKNKNPFLEEF